MRYLHVLSGWFFAINRQLLAIAWVSAAALGQIAHVQDGGGTSCAGNATSTSQGCPLPAQPTLGNSLFICAATDSTTPTVTAMTDNCATPNTYAVVQSLQTGNARIELWHTRITHTCASFQVSVSTAVNSYFGIAMSEFSGVAGTGSTPTGDGSTQGTSQGASPADAGTITTTNAADLVVGCMSAPSCGSTCNIAAAGSPGTFTLGGAQQNASCCESGALDYQIVAATNSYHPQFTYGGGSSAAVSAAYKAATGGSGTARRKVN